MQTNLKHPHFRPAVCSVWDKGYRYGFNGMDKDNEINVNGGSYDFGARIYDSRLGRWLSLDPLMRGYPKLSPYNFVDNSPLNSIDGDGRDIIILCANKRDGHSTGHQAILVGNENDGWDYYSFDGFKKNVNNGKTSDKHFKTLPNFVNSEYNSYQDNYDENGYFDAERDKDGKIIQRYDQGYRIKTDKATDEKMKNSAGTFLKNHTYFPSVNDCTDLPRVALDAAKLNNGEFTINIVIVPVGPLNLPLQILTPNLMPQTKQNEIEKSNIGTEIDNSLKRTTTDGNKTPTAPTVPSLPSDVKSQKDNTKLKTPVR
jgi:RHS repeat-associated protein